MITKTYSTYIDAAPEAVFDYVADVERHPDWAHERIEVEHLSGERGQAGAVYSYAVHFMGTTRGKLTVIEAHRPSTFVYECDDSSGLYRWTFDLRPQGRGVRLEHKLEFVRRSLKIKLIMPIMLPLAGNNMVNGGLENIKAALEPART